MSTTEVKPEPYTNQTAFDAVVAWLRRPDARRCAKPDDDSLMQGGACMYYDPATKNRCAIGGIMTVDQARAFEDVFTCASGLLEDRYETDEDDPNWENPYHIAKRVSVLTLFSKVDPELLNSLQEVHDARNNWGPNEKGLNYQGEKRFAEIATQYDLNYTPPS